jgi:hypothetical protein
MEKVYIIWFDPCQYDEAPWIGAICKSQESAEQWVEQYKADCKRKHEKKYATEIEEYEVI